MAWFHLKLEDFPDAEVPQLAEWFFPGKGILQTTLLQAFEMNELQYRATGSKQKPPEHLYPFRITL